MSLRFRSGLTRFRCVSKGQLRRVGGGELSCPAHLSFRRPVQVLEMPRWLQVIISASHTVPLPSTGD